jgi:ABC-type methionine transport system permease subunit
VIRNVAQAFAFVLLALIGIKVAASLATVSIGPIAALLGLVLIAMWLFDRHGVH